MVFLSIGDNRNFIACQSIIFHLSAYPYRRRLRPPMNPEQTVTPEALTVLAREAWQASGKTQTVAAEDFGVAQATFAQAVNDPKRNLTALRMRIIEAFTPYRVVGPEYRLVKKEEA